MTMILNDPKLAYYEKLLVEPDDEPQHVDEIQELFRRSCDLYVNYGSCEPSPLLHKVLCHLQRQETSFVENFPHRETCPACRKYYSVKMIIREHIQCCEKVTCKLEEALLNSGFTLQAIAKGNGKFDEGYVEDCEDIVHDYLEHVENNIFGMEEGLCKEKELHIKKY